MGGGWIWILLWILLALAVLIGVSIQIYNLRKAGAFKRKKRPFTDAIRIILWFSLSASLGEILIFIVVFFPNYKLSATAVAELWAIACLVAGGALGFLFGIPKSVQGASVATAEGKTRPQPAYAQRVNTSLEEVSDWLTKLLLGIGLVQLGKVPGLLRSYSKVINADSGALPNSEGFGIAIIVYFSILGFLGFYLITRLYLQRALGEAASMGLDIVTAGAKLSIEETIALKNSTIGFREGQRELTGAASNAAKRLLEEVEDIEELETAQDHALWGKAQLNEANYAKTDADKATAYAAAVDAYKQASELGPSDIDIQQEYAAALFLQGILKADWKHDQTFIDRVREPLMKACRLSPGATYEARKNLYSSLTWITLYATPPEKYNETIRLVADYERDPGHMPSGTIQVNLACAYGQKMKALKADEKLLSEKLKSATDDEKKLIDADIEQNKKDQKETRDKALQAVKSALDLDPTWTGPLIEVLIHSDKPDRDDYLTEFENDNDFRKELGLSRV